MLDIDLNKLPSGALSIRIQGPEKIYFDGKAEALSGVNDLGKFDILPLHANFISIVKDVIHIHKKGGPLEFKIDRGVLRASSNKIEIFLGIEIL